MLHKTSLHNWFFGIAGFVLVSGCSYQELSGTSSGSESSSWHYQKEFSISTFPDHLSGLTDGKVTVKAQCDFSPKLVNAYHERQKMVLMPFLTPVADGSFAPDFNGSLPVYDSLTSHLNLVPTVDSVQLFQRWVSSAEQACPADLNRNISQCSLKKLYSVGKLWGGDKPRLYNFERLNLWLEQREKLRFIVVPSLNILNSDAALSLRYSINSAPIVKKNTVERKKSAARNLGQSSVDWIHLMNKAHMPNELGSAGRCSVVWLELEALKQSGLVDYQKLIAADKAMRSVLLSFMNDAFQHSDLK